MGEAVLAFPAAAWPADAEPLADSAPADAYRALAERLRLTRPPCFWPALPGKPALTPLQRVALVRLAQTAPGAGGETQMVALMEAMRHAPSGDVVQTGAGGGRAAILLSWLARRYEIGPVLCLDSWDDDALRIFEINLAPLAEGGLNYLRASSAQAAPRYGEGLTVTTEAFGETRYQGQIAFLHIGGHAGADRDSGLWTPHVAPGGWIVFDGGPRAVADAFVAYESHRIAAQFEAGPARFVQLKR